MSKSCLEVPRVQAKGTGITWHVTHLLSEDCASMGPELLFGFATFNSRARLYRTQSAVKAAQVYNWQPPSFPNWHSCYRAISCMLQQPLPLLLATSALLHRLLRHVFSPCMHVLVNQLQSSVFSIQPRTPCYTSRIPSTGIRQRMHLTCP